MRSQDTSKSIVVVATISRNPREGESRVEEVAWEEGRRNI